MGRWLAGGGTFSDGAEPNPSEEAKVSRVMSSGDDGQDHSLQWPCWGHVEGKGLVVEEFRKKKTEEWCYHRLHATKPVPWPL